MKTPWSGSTSEWADKDTAITEKSFFHLVETILIDINHKMLEPNHCCENNGFEHEGGNFSEEMIRSGDL